MIESLCGWQTDKRPGGENNFVDFAHRLTRQLHEIVNRGDEGGLRTSARRSASTAIRAPTVFGPVKSGSVAINPLQGFRCERGIARGRGNAGWAVRTGENRPWYPAARGWTWTERAA
jgi:hypothetical protein